MNDAQVALYLAAIIMGEMAGESRGSASSPSVRHPAPAGASRCDWALWQLSYILAEIAKQTVQCESDADKHEEGKIAKRGQRRGSSFE